MPRRSSRPESPSLEAVPLAVSQKTPLLDAALALVKEFSGEIGNIRIDREIREIVEILTSSRLKPGVDFDIPWNVWSKAELFELLGLPPLNPTTKVLEITQGPGNKEKELGLLEGNLRVISFHPSFNPQIAMAIEAPDNEFDEVLGLHGPCADLIFTPECKKLLTQLEGSEFLKLALEENLRIFFASVQLAELIRITAPGGNIRIAGPRRFFKGVKLLTLLNLPAIRELLNIPDNFDALTEGDENERVGLILGKKIDAGNTKAQEFLRSQYRHLIPPHFFQVIKGLADQATSTD